MAVIMMADSDLAVVREGRSSLSRTDVVTRQSGKSLRHPTDSVISPFHSELRWSSLANQHRQAQPFNFFFSTLPRLDGSVRARGNRDETGGSDTLTAPSQKCTAKDR